MTDVATAGEHRPSLGARRLIGQGAGAAFVITYGARRARALGLA